MLTGDDLAVADVWAVAVGADEVGLSDGAMDRMRAARALVEEAAHGEHTYGVNTGFGRFVSRSIPDELAEELQLRLLRSHACGVGAAYPPEVVRAMRDGDVSDRRVPGSGMGLAIARGIVEAHHGRVWVEDAEGGTGAKFVIELPIESPSPGERGLR